MPCITRNKQGKPISATADNGERSILFDELNKKTPENAEDLYTVTQTEDFLEEVVKPKNVKKQVISEKGAQVIPAYAQTLERAKTMEKAGESYTDISDRTGWYKINGQWRMFSREALEQFKLKNVQDNTKTKLKDILDSGNILFQMYPALLEVEVIFEQTQPFQKESGNFNEDDILIKVNSLSERGKKAILAHEITHFLQTVEGLPKGGNPATVPFHKLKNLGIITKDEVNTGISSIEIRARIKDRLKDEATRKNMQEALDLFNAFMYREKKAEEVYRLLMGEVDAFLTMDAYRAHNEGDIVDTYEGLLEDYESRNNVNRKDFIFIDGDGNMQYIPETPNMVSPVLEQLQKTKLAKKVNILSNEGINEALSQIQSQEGVSKQNLKVDNPIWKSTAKEGLSKIQQRNATPEQWTKMIADKGGKGTTQELEWIGLEDFLKEYLKENNVKSIPKDVVEQYINDNQIEIVEVTKGAPTEEEIQTLLNDEVGENMSREDATDFLDTDTRHSQYTLEGGTNYREILFTLPNKTKDETELELQKLNESLFFEKDENKKNEVKGKIEKLLKKQRRDYESPPNHWDELNILAFARIDERTLPNGERVLMVQESQSDWQAEGREKGFDVGHIMTAGRVWSEKAKERGYTGKTVVERDEFLKNHPDLKAEFDNISKASKNRAVPQMPYKKTDQYLGMMFRRMMQMATEEGFDRIAWITGEQGADRYNLSKQIDFIDYSKNSDGTYNFGSDVEGTSRNDASIDDVKAMFGKEIAKKIEDGDGINSPINSTQRRLEGLDLEVGGEGMKTFYNSIVPKVALKEAQRFDKSSKIEVIEMPLGNTAWNIDIKKETLEEQGKKITKDEAIQYKFNKDEYVVYKNPFTNEIYRLYNEQDVVDTGYNNIYIVDNKTLSKQLSIKLTPKAKESLKEAIPLFQKAENVVNGFVFNNEVFINKSLTSPETAIHEFGHLYLDFINQNNNDIYKAGLNLIDKNKKEAKAYIDFVNKNQPDLEQGSEKWQNEVLAQIIGDNGAKLIGNNLKTWLQEFWESVKNILGLTEYSAEQVSNMTLKEFGQAVSKDLLSGRSFEGTNGEANFNRWKGNNELFSGTDVQNIKTGQPVIVKAFHGTTNEFYEFDSDVKGNIEGHLGKVNYFTTDEGDANQNYHSDGADITSRVDQRQDELEDTLRYEYFDEDLKGLSFEQIKEAYNISEEAAESLYPNGIPEVVKANEISRFLAERELKGDNDTTLEVYLKLNNPVVIGSGQQWIETFPEKLYEEYMEDAAQEVADENDISLKEAQEDYSYDIIERAKEASGEENPLIEAMQNAIDDNTYDQTVDGKMAAEILGDFLYDPEVEVNQLERHLREELINAQNEDGDLSSTQIIADFFKYMGYDGIILADVSRRFKNMGLGNGTSHVHVFNQYSNRIKLSDGTNITFDENNKDIRYSKTNNEGEFNSNGVTINYRPRVNPITNQQLKGVEIELISTLNELRGQGRAKQALKEFLRQTDELGQDTYLFASPRDKTTSEKGLMNFYRSLGFTSDEFLPQEMLRRAQRVRTPQTATLAAQFDKNGEVFAKDVYQYVDRKNAQGIEPTQQDRVDIIKSLDSNTPNSDILLENTRKAFYREGLFSPTMATLTKNGYIKAEATNILSNLSLQARIKENIAKLENLRETIQIDEIESPYETISSMQPNFVGKYQQANPYVAQQQIVETLGGIKDQNEYMAAVMENGMDVAKNDFQALSQYTALEVKEVNDAGEIVERKLNRTQELLEETLTDPTNDKVRQALDYILNIPPDIAMNSQVEIADILLDLKEKAIDVGVDLTGIEQKYTEKGIGELTRFLVGLRMLNAKNIGQFAETYNNFFDVDTESNEVEKIKNVSPTTSKIYNRTKTAFEMFSENGLLYAGNNLYRKVNNRKTLQETLDIMVQRTNLFPQSIFEGINMTNTVQVRKAIENHTNTQVQNIETGNLFDADALRVFYLNSLYFKTPTNIEQNLKDVASVVGEEINTQYLSTDFIADFNKESLKEKNKNSQKYKDFYSNFKIIKEGITPINTDPISIQIMEEYMDKNLRNYFTIKKDNAIFARPNEATYTDSHLVDRNRYINFPKALPLYKGLFEQVSNRTVKVDNGAESFIRTQDGVYELMENNGTDAYYAKLPNNTSPYILTTEMIPEIDVEPTTPKQAPKDTVEVINLYTKAEEKLINDQLECG